MHKLLLLMIVVLIGFSSCGPNELVVKTNSNQIFAVNDYHRIYSVGDSLMIVRTPYHDWQVSTTDQYTTDTSDVFKQHARTFRRVVVITTDE